MPTSPHPDQKSAPDDAIAALIGSRICHDLVSPLGAISNGLELLGMAVQNTTTPELRLIAESVDHANARVKFFRIAFGAASGEQVVSEREARAILNELGASGRTRFAWDVTGARPRDQVKLAFLLVMCAESALPRGGVISVAQTGGGWTVGAKGPRVAFDPALWALFDGEAAGRALLPAEVQFALAPAAAAAIGRQVTAQNDETSVDLRF